MKKGFKFPPDYVRARKVLCAIGFMRYPVRAGWMIKKILHAAKINAGYWKRIQCDHTKSLATTKFPAHICQEISFALLSNLDRFDKVNGVKRSQIVRMATNWKAKIGLDIIPKGWRLPKYE